MTETNELAERIGPCFTRGTVAKRLGIPARSLDDLATEGRVLMLSTSDNLAVCPAFQFTVDGTFRSELLPVLNSLTLCPAWTAALWLRTPHDDLDELTPDEWLAAGRDPDVVRVLAGQFAWAISF